MAYARITMTEATSAEELDAGEEAYKIIREEVVFTNHIYLYECFLKWINYFQINRIFHHFLQKFQKSHFY